MEKQTIRLTDYARTGGCGAKLPPGLLGELLSTLPPQPCPALLVGFDGSDDGAVYCLEDGTALIQTVDFFPPIVNDPFTFGQIAAANALSDIYAMGGEPFLALNLLCFPLDLPLEAARDILAGGLDKAREAGAVIAGGHSIDDVEPKYGLCVTGRARREEILTNSGARPGDLLLLTKPLGAGILTSAARVGLLEEGEERSLYRRLATLNKYARDIMMPFRPHACTDVTGFSLLGHSCELAEGSGGAVELWAEALPIPPLALELARDGIMPGAVHRNRAALGEKIALEGGIPLEVGDALFDPQTSGGLLIALPEGAALALLEALGEGGVEAALVGQVLPWGEGPRVRVRRGS